MTRTIALVVIACIIACSLTLIGWYGSKRAAQIAWALAITATIAVSFLL